MVPTCSASLDATGATGWTALPPMTTAPLLGTQGDKSYIKYRSRSTGSRRGSAGHLLEHDQAGPLEVLAKHRLGARGVPVDDRRDHRPVLLLRLAQAGQRAHVHAQVGLDDDPQVVDQVEQPRRVRGLVEG